MDVTELLLSDPLNRTLVSLLAGSSAHEAEKQLWLTLIPVMSIGEKHELKANLEKQIQEDSEYDERVLRKFIATVSQAA